MIRTDWMLNLAAAAALSITSLAGAADVALTPQNTKIQFVCAHAGDKPDPRTGHFAAFTGTAAVDGSTLKSITVDIDTKSITTEFEKLTGHLKSPDFFDVNEHPKAKFVSKTITAKPDGKVEITGDLTLHGVTKSITFPATVSTASGLTLTSEFKLDRTQFGMNFATDKVEKDVTMTVTIK
jgi:polyisoprenoid-binding protein YceI